MPQLVSLAPLPLWMALAAVYAFIAISSAIAMAIPSVRRSPNMINPILGWWPVSLVGTLAVFFGPAPSVAVLGAVSAGVFLEALALVGLPPRLHRLIAALGVGIAMLVHLMMLVDGVLATTLALALPMLLVPAAQLFSEATTAFIRNVGGAQWILLATVGMFSFGARLVTSDVGGPYGGQGAAFVFFVLVMLSDALQWIGGKVLGRTPLVPRVSPKKTWEGFLFGAGACGAAGALIGPSVMGLSVVMGAVLGTTIVALGLFGDILASGWKRDAGVKDSGTLIPGQGGLLDRCDSILFVAPWFYLFTTATLS
jgi:phosphatidate cytidylyltransferase